MGNSSSSNVLDDVLREEFDLSDFMRRTMASSAVDKDVTKFNTFCKKLIKLPKEKRFPFAFDFFESIEGFPTIDLKSMKSSVVALEFKNLGNAAFGRGHFVAALKYYTKSIAVAPVGSSDLALAYGNRSAALFELQRYEGCIVDINRALNENCSETPKTKLLNRKQQCRSKMMELNAIEFDHQKSVGQHSAEGGMCEKKQDCPIDEDALDLDYTGKFPLPQANLQNRSISNASENIRIAFNSTFGRHIVATKDIKVGEIIGIEKAYASVLFNSHRYSHCANCFLRCEALIPCPGCAMVMYCSRRCREDDFNQSHRIKCQIFVHSFSLGLPLPTSLQLAIQTLMVVTKQGENLKTLMKDPRLKDPMKQAPNTVPEKLCPQNHAYHLLNLLNDDRLYAYPHDSSSLSEAALSLYRVIIVGHILRQTTYYDSAMAENIQVNNDSIEERKYVGLLFLKLMISLPRYSLGVEELLQKKVADFSTHSDGQLAVGSGVYLFHSLFSHSCFMNITGSFHNDTMVSQTTQPLKAGQQLFFNYCSSFLKIPRTERQKQLRSAYQFECRCVACKEDWPLMSDITNELLFTRNRTISTSPFLLYKDEFESFFDNPLVLIEYNSELFDLFCKCLTNFHKKNGRPISEFFIIFFIFELLLQSRGNNYVYTRDDVLMSL